MTKPTFTFFVSTQNLGTIYKETNEIITKFTDANVPLTQTSGRISFNLGGKTRIIMIQGANNGVGFNGANHDGQVASFISTMEGWINASPKQSPKNVNSYGVSYLVDCVDWTWERSNKDPGRILFTIIMKETMTIS